MLHARAHGELAVFAVHQRVAHATVFGDADALSTARRRRGTSMDGVALRGVRPEHALVGPFGHMRVVANAVGPEPPLVADAFIAVAVSVREALGVALLPLRTVGHDEPERTVAPAFSVASTVAQVTITVVGTTVGCTVDARVSTEALAGQMRGVGRPTDAMARACLRAGTHATSVTSPPQLA